MVQFIGIHTSHASALDSILSAFTFRYSKTVLKLFELTVMEISIILTYYMLLYILHAIVHITCYFTFHHERGNHSFVSPMSIRECSKLG